MHLVRYWASTNNACTQLRALSHTVRDFGAIRAVSSCRKYSSPLPSLGHRSQNEHITRGCITATVRIPYGHQALLVTPFVGLFVLTKWPGKNMFTISIFRNEEEIPVRLKIVPVRGGLRTRPGVDP